MTAILARTLALNWKLLPLAAVLLFWFFFSGFRAILRSKEDRLARELLLCLSCFGLLYALLCFATYGLVDPANGFARPGSVPVSAASLARFALMGWCSVAVAVASGAVLEWRMRSFGGAARARWGRRG